MSGEPALLVLDFPGRRPEAHISELALDEHGFDSVHALESPLPTSPTTAEYAEELCVRRSLGRPAAILAYCATAPLAVAVSKLLGGPAGSLPIVLFDPQPTPSSEIAAEYDIVTRQVEERMPPEAERPPRLAIERLLATPELAIERIGEDLRLRAVLTLAAFGFTGSAAGKAAEGVVGLYIEWLTFLVGAHHAEQPGPRGPVLQVLSRAHTDDLGWLGAADVRTVRVSCDRNDLAAARRRGPPSSNSSRRWGMPPELATDTEIRLSRIWSEVLALDSVGRHEDFFLLGGDSMLATVVVMSVRREWKVEFSVRVLFDAPVLKDLAGRIDALAAESHLI